MIIKPNQFRLLNVLRHREAKSFRVTDIPIGHEGENHGEAFPGLLSVAPNVQSPLHVLFRPLEG